MKTDQNFTFKLPPFKVTEVMTSLSQSIDWGLRKLNIPEIWNKTKGEGITICVIDTGFPGSGVGKTHPDLKENADASKSKSFVPGESMYDTVQGHGTMCAGIICGEDNEIGFVGYAPKAKVIAIKALSNNGCGTLEYIENALEYALQIKPDIVSMSLGASCGSLKMHYLIKELDKLNIPVVVAAGNGGASEGVLYPAKYEECFAIGAYDEHGKIANFSAVGPEVDFSFPGVNITSTYINGKYATMNGTSFACPACTGVIALLLSAHKKAMKEGKESEFLSTWDIYDKLKKLAKNPLKEGSKDPRYGWGIVDTSMLKTKTLICKENKKCSIFERILNIIKAIII